MTVIESSDDVNIAEVDFGMDDIVDLPALVARMRATEPASWVRFIGEPTLHLNTYELVNAAFRDETSIPGHIYYLETQEPIMGSTVQSLHGEQHRMARSLQAPFFRQRLMADYVAPVFLPVANELIDKFVARGEANLVTEFAKQYPMRVIMKVLDLDPNGDIDWARLAWEMIQGAYDPLMAVKAIAEFDEHVVPLLDERRRHPGTDLISALISAEVDGERMNETDVLSFVRLMFPAGTDTTFLGMGNIVLALLTHPEALAQTLADPVTEARWAIEEALRWQPSVAHLPRRVRDAVEWRGISIPAGTPVLLSVMGANRDPAVFADPDRFDLGRRPQGTMTFGLAAHHCLGIHFARAEMDVALRTLLDRLPNLRLAADRPVPVVHGALLRGPEELHVTFG